MERSGGVRASSMAVLVGLTPKRIITCKQTADILIPFVSSAQACLSLKTRYSHDKFHARARAKGFLAVKAVSSGVKYIEASPSHFEGFSVTRISTDKANELKIVVEVSGAKAEVIFNNVFNNMVAEAQPIPGFRRTKGGKTPNIPRDILLQVLGPSKVYKQVIKKIINSTVAEYIEKEGLSVRRSLRVEQSFEDLENTFEPGDKFGFEAIIYTETSK